jgi:ketosteroid isomerase-like protein
MSRDEAGAVAERYFAAWKANDWEMLRGLLADDVSFRGPLAPPGR